MPQIQRIPDHSGRGSVGHAEHTAEFSGGETADGWGAVPDHSGRGSVGHAEHTAEFCGSETADGWGAVPAQPDRVFGAGQPTLHDRLAKMQVSPMRRDLQPADLGGDQGGFVGLSGGERAGAIQPHQIIFEHTSCISA
jgi:hypothetical protein